MKNRIDIESYSALSFGVPLGGIQPQPGHPEVQLSSSPARARQRRPVSHDLANGMSHPSPVSRPRPAHRKVLKIFCETRTLEPLVLELWLVKQPFAPGSGPCVLAPPADLRSPSAGGFEFWRPRHEN